jgi:hypothetical protein
MAESNLIEETRSRYINNQERRKLGIIDYLPIHHIFPRLSHYIPGFMRGTNILISAGTGVGKSQLGKFFTIMAPYIFNKEVANLKYKVLYFALEESKQEIIDGLVCALINLKYNTNVDVFEINSYRENPLSEFLLKRIDEALPIVEDMLKNVEIFDTILNPTGIYKTCRHYSELWGKHIKVNKEFVKNGIVSVEEVYSHYQPNDDTQVFVVVDHLSLLSEEAGAPTLAESMKRWSFNYARSQITKHWKWTVFNIQQQMAAVEEQEFYKNNLNVQKLKPSLFGLADNKKTARDHHLILFLFAPDRFEIENYLDFDIKTMGDSFRSLIIGKNRIGIPNIEIPLKFYGNKILFTELNLK